MVTCGRRAEDWLVALFAEEGIVLAVPAVDAERQVLVVVVVGQPKLRVAVSTLEVPAWSGQEEVLWVVGVSQHVHAHVGNGPLANLTLRPQHRVEVSEI